MDDLERLLDRMASRRKQLPQRSSVWWLEAWAERIRTRIATDRPVSRYEMLTYRPSVTEKAELLALSKSNPTAASIIQSVYTETDQAFAGCKEKKTSRRFSLYMHHLGRLAETLEHAFNAIAEQSPPNDVMDKGVSLHDVGIAMGFVDEEVTDFVRRFIDSKRITAEKIGQCPNDKRRKLYRLSEIMSDLESFSRLNSVEKRRIRKHLESVERLPAK